MNPATHGTEGNALTPVLYMALELSNKTWRLALSDGAKGRHGRCGTDNAESQVRHVRPHEREGTSRHAA